MTLEKLYQCRNRADAWVRRYFADHGFLEVHTRARVPSPGTDVYIDPLPSQGQWLITSPELQHKRLLCQGFSKIYEFARCFRDEELGPWHQPEFTLLEWYRVPADIEEVMRDTEHLVLGLAKLLSRGELRREGRSLRVAPPFPRLTVRQAFERFAPGHDPIALSRDDEDAYFKLWVDQVEPGLERFEEPVFVTEFPLSQAALARPKPDDPDVAERFELYALGVELCNGYGELTDAQVQRQRFEQDNLRRRARGKPELPIDEAFLAALDNGMPPAAGNALGFERLLALCLGTTLSSVVPFPAASFE